MANYIESAPFYYNQGIAGEIAYRDYQQKVAMTQDITDSITNSINRSIAANAVFAGEIQSTLVNNQIATENAMYNNTRDMIGAFNSGFSDVSRQIGAMSANMSMAFAALNTTVQESAQAICDRLDTMNDILNNPSLTKTRELYRRAAVSYNKGFYEEARNDLLDALASNKIDYISWFLLGKTYLFGAGEFSNVIDLDAAVDAMKNAVKFITPDARKQEDARALAAEMCFYLGLAQQTRAMDALHTHNEADCLAYLEQAGGSYSQSWDYSAQMLEARYNRARCKALLGDVQGAIADLEALILVDRNYCIKVCADNDFAGITAEFAALIRKLKNAAFIPAQKDYDRLKTLLSELAALGGTTKVTIPSTFTEELPYFDVLDYAKDFKRIIQILEKGIAEKKAAIERAKLEEIYRQARAEQAERERLERERLAKERSEREAREAKEKAEVSERLLKVRERIAKYQVCISANFLHTVGLKRDGTVIAVGDNSQGQCKVSGWRDIVAVAAGFYHTVGLKADGTVVAVGDNSQGQCKVNDWRDIVAVSVGDNITVGLKADGTVIAVGYTGNNQWQVSDWRDIVAVAAGDGQHIVGLKADGTVVAVGNDKFGQCWVSGWCGIVAVAAGCYHTVGLKADGTVVAAGDNGDECNVIRWRDMVAVAAGSFHTVGLKADGTVVAVGNNDDGQCDVSDWRDIVAVAAHDHTVGIKADGTVVAVGKNEYGKCNISGWRNIGPRQAQGLCAYCGGQLGGLFTKKCKSCGKEN